MLLHYRCLQAMLFRRILDRLRGRKNADLRRYKYETFDISKYLETAERLNINITPLGFGFYELQRGDIYRRFIRSLTDKESALTYKLCGNKYIIYN